MGCRWQPSTDVDMNLFSSVEVINGGAVMFSSTRYWDTQLTAGHRLAAIGGSDSHNATALPKPPDSIGWPTTVVEADNLSVPAILKGIRSGRTFVDLTASHDKTVDFEADAGGSHARMGDTLDDPNGGALHVHVYATACEGSMIHILLDGAEVKPASPIAITDDVATVAADVTPGKGRHWLRLEIQDSKGQLELLTSPIYINFPAEDR